MAEVLAKAEKYINGEEALISKKESSSTRKEKSATDKRRGRSPRRQSGQEKSQRKDRERSPKRRGNLRDRLGPLQSKRRRRYSPHRFTPLTASVSQVLHEVRNEQFLRRNQTPPQGTTPSIASPQGLRTPHGQLYTIEKRDRIFNTTWVPPAFHISRKASHESGSKSGP